MTERAFTARDLAVGSNIDILGTGEVIYTVAGLRRALSGEGEDCTYIYLTHVYANNKLWSNEYRESEVDEWLRRYGSVALLLEADYL